MRHVLIWLSDDPSDLPLLCPDRPDLIVRLTLTGTWPADIDGIPVMPVYQIEGTERDNAYEQAVAYMKTASRHRGLDEIRCGDGISLWWAVSVLVFDSLWLWFRAVLSVRAIVDRLEAERVTIWGSDRRLPWLRPTVLHVLGTYPTLGVAAPVPRLPRRAEPVRAGVPCLGGWRAEDGDADLVGDASTRTRIQDGRFSLVTLGGRASFRRPLPEGTNVLRVVLAAQSGNVAFSLDDGRWRQTVTVRPDGVSLGDRSCALPPAVSRCCTLVLADGRSGLLVDDEACLEAPCAAGDGGGAHACWGHLVGGPDSESAWTSVAWGALPFTPSFASLCDARDRFERALTKLEALAEERLGPIATENPPGLELLGCWENPDPIHVVSLDQVVVQKRRLPAGVQFVRLRAARHSGGSTGIGFHFDDGRHAQTVYLDAASVSLAGGGSAPCDTSASRAYELVLEQGEARLYVDGALLVSAAASRGREPLLRFGSLNAAGDAESTWSDIAWGRPSTRQSTLHVRLVDEILEARRAIAGRAGPLWLAAVEETPVVEEVPSTEAAAAVQEVPRAPLLRPEGKAPPLALLPQSPGGLLVLSIGGELRTWVDGEGRTRVCDPLTEGVVPVLAGRGVPFAQVSIGAVAAQVEGSGGMRALESWFELMEEDAVPSLRAGWAAWRGEGRDRFPDVLGVSPDRLLVGAIEEALPHLTHLLAERRALRRCLSELRPRAVIGPRFPSAHRHLLDPVRESGALAVGLIVGCDPPNHLLYGHFVPASTGMPVPDFYSSWGERQRRELPPCDLDVVATGRSRIDVFVERGLRPDEPRWLHAIGLPGEARRVVVFADVLRSSLQTSILTRGTCEMLLRGVMEGLGARRDIHLVWKPWPGDDLDLVREVAAAVGDDRVHVFDPHASPYHNADLLCHAITAVSSPTSMLAEFAAMGGGPILLRLPETLYYYGRSIHDVFTGFCRVVERVDDMAAATAEVIARDQRSLSPEQAAALADGFGPGDGRSAARLLDEIERRLAVTAI
jgi:hypothetical protein